MKIQHIISLFLILLGCSCREVYYPDEISSPEKIPVIQGMISAYEMPVVKLSWAIRYNDDFPEYISDAEVYIIDDTEYGATYPLVETTPGTYQPYYDFYGMPGHIYTLRVVLPDGNEFISSSQALRDAPIIDSLYADPGTRETFTYSTSGKPVISMQQGLDIYSDLSAPGNEVYYFRFNTRVLKEMVYTVEVGTPQSHSIYIWEVKNLDYSYSVDYSVTQDYRQVLLGHPIGFLRYFYDVSLETPDRTAPFTAGWVLTYNVFTISRDVFEYYQSIERQLSSNDQIFAPVASQVKSTIHCVNDPSEKVIGVFEASSRTTIYKAFGWKGLFAYYSRELPWFPDISEGGTSPRFPPDFWVYL